MTMWGIYVGVVIFHTIMGGTLKEILLGVAINNILLLFGPLHYLNMPELIVWVEVNRMALSLILSLILAFYILKGLHFLAEFYQR